MSFSARLEDLELSSLLHLIALNRNSGRLRLTRRDADALLVFRQGRIIYAATNSIRETFGSILLLRGLIDEQTLSEALERQHSMRQYQRLGEILAEMGRVSREELYEVMRQQTESVIGELITWTTGFFKFEPMEVAAGGEIEVDVKEFLVAEGFDTQEVLLHAATRLDESRRDDADGALPRATGAMPAAPLDLPEAPRALSEVVGDHQPAAFGGETALALMRYAAQVVSRGVLLLVRSDAIVGIGQFGVGFNGHPASNSIRNLSIPLDEPSVFAQVIGSRQTYRGPLEKARWNDALAERLGGGRPSEVVVIPMIVGGGVRILFYGDNRPEDGGIGPIDGVEFMMAEAAAGMESGRTGRRR
jgi:hypothetical protein